MSGSRPSLRIATESDLRRFYPEKPIPTIKAWVAEIDGEQLGFGGYAWRDGRWQIFFDITDRARRFKVGIVRAARQVLSDADSNGIRYLYAVPDETEPMAIRWLTALGFEPDHRVSQLMRRENPNGRLGVNRPDTGTGR